MTVWPRPAPASLRGFLLGLTAGAVYFAGTLYWLTDVMRLFGGLPWAVGVVLNAGLVAYLALYPAFFALVIVRVWPGLGTRTLLLAPAVWVASELARTVVFGGFPWVLLGYSQVRALPVAQVASLLGVYGVSGLVVLGNVAITMGLVARGRLRIVTIAITAALVLLTGMWGNARLRGDRLLREGTGIRVGLIQGNVAQENKWDSARAEAIVRNYVGLTRQAAGRGARFILWPESSTPFFFEEDQAGGDLIRALARETGATLLVGSDQIERGSPPRYYNAAFLVSPAGRTEAVYRKIHLVPYGEFVPMKRLLFFAAPLVDSVSDFTPGTEHVMLPVDGHLASAAICYEVVYPALIRDSVIAGSQLLTTITNDAWYGRSSAPYQHFAQARLRAIEQGRYLVRAANTGISGIVDPYGREIVASKMFEPAVIVDDVRFLSELTVYARIGDLFAYLCTAFTAAALLASRRRRK